MNTQPNLNKEQEGIPQKVVIVYPPERVEVKYTAAELELLLQQYEKEVHKVDWSLVGTLAGLVLALLIPLLTVENFKTFSWLSGESIKGFILLGTLSSGVFFLYYFVRNCYYLCIHRPLNAHQLVENKIKEMRKLLEAEYPKLKPTTFGGTTQNEPGKREAQIDKI